MFIPKKYGQSKIENCPFCQKQATAMNRQNVPVCIIHKEESLDDLKCICGKMLDMKHGKYGVFFTCMSCGNMNLKKVMEFSKIKPKIKNERPDFFMNRMKTQNRTTTTVRSDDPRYFD